MRRARPNHHDLWRNGFKTMRSLEATVYEFMSDADSRRVENAKQLLLLQHAYQLSEWQPERAVCSWW